MAWYIENDIPGVLYNGLNTQRAVDFSGASSITFGSKALTVGAVSATTLSASGILSIVTGSTATAGGAVAVQIGTSNVIGIYYGSSTPTITAPKGSLYLRTDGLTTTSRMYVNTDGSTTWTGVTTAA